MRLRMVEEPQGPVNLPWSGVQPVNIPPPVVPPPSPSNDSILPGWGRSGSSPRRRHSVGLKRPIREPTVNPAPPGAGRIQKIFRPKAGPGRGQRGKISVSSPPALRGERIAVLFAHRIPCVVLCPGSQAGTPSCQMAESRESPRFTTSPLITMKFISRANLRARKPLRAAPRCMAWHIGASSRGRRGKRHPARARPSLDC